MKTLSEKIAVMQAAERGEAIEVSIVGSQSLKGWYPTDTTIPVFDWAHNDYRIAPKKPREFFVLTNPDGKPIGVSLADEPKTPAFQHIEVKVIRVREVVEEPKVAIARDYQIEPLIRMTRYGREWSHDGGTTWTTSWSHR